MNANSISKPTIQELIYQIEQQTAIILEQSKIHLAEAEQQARIIEKMYN